MPFLSLAFVTPSISAAHKSLHSPPSLKRYDTSHQCGGCKENPSSRYLGISGDIYEQAVVKTLAGCCRGISKHLFGVTRFRGARRLRSGFLLDVPSGHDMIVIELLVRMRMAMRQPRTASARRAVRGAECEGADAVHLIYAKQSQLLAFMG